jgi:hypothetical protein
VVVGVTGLTDQRLDRELDAVASAGNAIPAPTRSICHQLHAFVLQPSSGGIYQPSPE